MDIGPSGTTRGCTRKYWVYLLGMFPKSGTTVYRIEQRETFISNHHREILTMYLKRCQTL